MQKKIKIKLVCLSPIPSPVPGKSEILCTTDEISQRRSFLSAEVWGLGRSHRFWP